VFIFSADVGSSAARLSALVGENGLALGDTGEPEIILTGPGTHSLPGPLESTWTADGFLLIKDGEDETHYVHPSNTLFNLDHPITLRSKYRYNNRPQIKGYQAFTLIDIIGKYREELTTSAEKILGHTITDIVIVLPDGQNVRTTAKRIINDTRWGNYTRYEIVYVGGHDPRETERRVILEAFKRGENISLPSCTGEPLLPFIPLIMAWNIADLYLSIVLAAQHLKFQFVKLMAELLRPYPPSTINTWAETTSTSAS